ncbi:hypothetical protein [Clostridium beijerinckii]|uniref:Bacteriocin n=1 Tax=Clostridium beijerinckii TaxID=1520 RepID=A0AAX0B9L5_CLOBE|nr:hypothetical protein [Clostridium beijerinckii]MBA8933715.1 hypothetical protein [Clostridium beijerinckii]NRT92120.1 hypothetical protein [Clostridium beijerinckii]NRU37912.1 hypothetical protein [Clostridium beijerinckii]NSA98809.1 hypothetical protein [Clostridium beijerinckii]NYC71648.1 hypothetical protein [Clostridium beijerinckii]
MKKKIMSFLLVAAATVSLGVAANAAVGDTVQGSGGGTSYHGHVEGSNTDYGCYGETYTWRDSGSRNVYAYVEVVNGDGEQIGAGKANTGSNYADSGCVSRKSGENAYGSCGTSDSSTRTFCRLYE